MIEFTFSDKPPMMSYGPSFRSKFFNCLEFSDNAKLASGYISTDSLAELKKLIEDNKGPCTDLLIGMHKFDGFTRPQYKAAIILDEFLREKTYGGVYISHLFRFHGKAYTFLKDNTPVTSLVGSSNLNNILEGHNSFEIDVFTDDPRVNNRLNSFFDDFIRKSAQPISECKDILFIEKNSLLEDHENVTKLSQIEVAQIMASRLDKKFVIPLKAGVSHQKSNLNVFFGKGRMNKRGFVKPRPWYEVEIIVPNTITSLEGYPISSKESERVINVVTDDGWSFKCKTSGDYSKNFRSADDLKILGRWIKGRLENNGCLDVSKPITCEVLEEYGRSHFDLFPTTDPNIWFLDFGVKK